LEKGGGGEMGFGKGREKGVGSNWRICMHRGRMVGWLDCFIIPFLYRRKLKCIYHFISNFRGLALNVRDINVIDGYQLSSAISFESYLSKPHHFATGEGPKVLL